MRRADKRSRFSWKTIKYIAQSMSIGIVIIAVVVCSIEIPPKQGERETVEFMDVTLQNSIENEGVSAKLNIQGTEIVTTEESEVAKMEQEEKTQETDASEQKQQEACVEEASQQKIEERTQSDKKEFSGKNRVVQTDTTNQRGDAITNRVVENPKPDKLVSKLFENYGEKPVVADDVMTVYQYPVELGYSVDSNYDGKLTMKNTILNFTADTQQPEAVVEDNSDEVKETVDSEGVKNAGEEVTTEESVDEEAAEESTTEKVEQRDLFKQEIWRQIMPTEPLEVCITATEAEAQSVKKEKKNEKEVSTGNTTEVSKEEVTTPDTSDGELSVEKEASTEKAAVQQEDKVVADKTYFIIKGKMRTGSSVFVDDIVIVPSGKDGFNKIRIGKEGEFKDSVTVTEDATNKEIELYFTDGENVTTGVLWKYSKDTTNPELMLKKDSYHVLESDISKIYCTNKWSLDIEMGEGDKQTSNVRYIYGDKLVYITDLLNGGKPSLQQEFFGRMLMNSTDHAGNVSSVVSEYFLVEQNVPTITFSHDKFCTVPYSLWIQVADEGHIISGIQDIVCMVNGEKKEIKNAEVLQKVVLDDGLEVPSNMLFPITFEEEGSYTVEVTVTDHAGNVATLEKHIEVTKPELVSIYMPENFTIHIDPQQLAGREQIFSDAIELKNVSDFDVEVVVDSIVVHVKDEVSKEGTVKDCEMFLVAPDTGEKISLKNGDNKNVYSYRLAVEEEGASSGLCFVGNTSEGSDAMWKGSDISVEVKLSFRKWTK